MIAPRIIRTSIPTVQVRGTMGKEHVDGKVEVLPERTALWVDGGLDVVHESLVMRAITSPTYLEWPNQAKEGGLCAYSLQRPRKGRLQRILVHVAYPHSRYWVTPCGTCCPIEPLAIVWSLLSER